MTDVYLIFGKNGWIGGKLQELLKAQGKAFHLADSRTQNREAVLAEIEKYKPTHVLNAAGVTGRPNVDWCEDNKQETIRANVLGTLTVADICAQKGIHHLLYATGCIFEYDDAHTIGGTGFTEEDSPNFHGSFYSHTKVRVPPRRGCDSVLPLLSSLSNTHTLSLSLTPSYDDRRWWRIC